MSLQFHVSVSSSPKLLILFSPSAVISACLGALLPHRLLPLLIPSTAFLKVLFASTDPMARLLLCGSPLGATLLKREDLNRLAKSLVHNLLQIGVSYQAALKAPSYLEASAFGSLSLVLISHSQGSRNIRYKNDPQYVADISERCGKFSEDNQKTSFSGWSGTSGKHGRAIIQEMET